MSGRWALWVIWACATWACAEGAGRGALLSRYKNYLRFEDNPQTEMNYRMQYEFPTTLTANSSRRFVQEKLKAKTIKFPRFLPVTVPAELEEVERNSVQSDPLYPNVSVSRRRGHWWWTEPTVKTLQPGYFGHEWNTIHRLYYTDYWYWKDAGFIEKCCCYSCGMGPNYNGIPVSPMCYQMFDSASSQYHRLRFRHRVCCYYNPNGWRTIPKGKRIFGTMREDWDNGGIIRQFGLYNGGCYKRFLDVGIVYWQRGCRSWPPTHGSWSHATHRFTKLEIVFNRYTYKDMCIHTPVASLTPFSRSISLYVRYHICICYSRFCNTAPDPNTISMYMTISLIVVYYNFVF